MKPHHLQSPVMTRCRRVHQRGQAAVLVSLTLFTMVVFMAMATNTGSLVNERIRIQNAADLAAYAGAHEQASKLNEIAFLNDSIQQIVTYCRQRLTNDRTPSMSREWSKVWNQCLPETGGDYDEPFLPLPPRLKATRPVHDMRLLPPNRDTPGWLTGFPRKYGPSNECQSDYDSRANDLINWCERSVQYYASIIFDIADWGNAYEGTPSTNGFSSLLFQRPIKRTVIMTANKNYPRPSTVELLDEPEKSPVREGRFYQWGVESTVDTPPYVTEYNRRGGPSMVPLERYTMKFNYVFKCCSKTKVPCGPEQCGSWGNIIFRNVGPVNYEDSKTSFKPFDTVYSRPKRGTLYLPVRVYGNPKDHDVPLLDNPSRRDDANYFGGWGAWNDLRAVAVAKPFEGFIGPSPDTFDTYEVNEPGVRVPLAPRALSPLYVSGGLVDMLRDGYKPYDTYRARLAGFREQLKSAGEGVSATNPAGSMLDILVQHVVKKPEEADEDPMDFGHTSH